MMRQMIKCEMEMNSYENLLKIEIHVSTKTGKEQPAKLLKKDARRKIVAKFSFIDMYYRY